LRSAQKTRGRGYIVGRRQAPFALALAFTLRVLGLNVRDFGEPCVNIVTTVYYLLRAFARLARAALLLWCALDGWREPRRVSALRVKATEN
jgi:hypothetical protein